MKALICGGRDYAELTNTKKPISTRRYEIQSVQSILAYLKHSLNITSIINGGAKGVDSCAHTWAIKNSLSTVKFPADWKQYGKAAGHIRNSQMLLQNPDMVVAFPGGKGTLDMVTKAKKNNTLVLSITSPVSLDFLSISRAVWDKNANKYYLAMEPFTDDSEVDWTGYYDLPEYQKDYWRACAQREFLFYLMIRSKH